MKLLFIILTIISFDFFALGQSRADYKIWRENCFKDGNCMVFAYVNSHHYDKANMQKLAEELADKYKEKNIVNFRVFNDEKLSKLILTGIAK